MALHSSAKPKGGAEPVCLSPSLTSFAEWVEDANQVGSEQHPLFIWMGREQWADGPLLECRFVCPHQGPTSAGRTSGMSWPADPPSQPAQTPTLRHYRLQREDFCSADLKLDLPDIFWEDFIFRKKNGMWLQYHELVLLVQSGIQACTAIINR